MRLFNVFDQNVICTLISEDAKWHTQPQYHLSFFFFFLFQDKFPEALTSPAYRHSTVCMECQRGHGLFTVKKVLTAS